MLMPIQGHQCLEIVPLFCFGLNLKLRFHTCGSGIVVKCNASLFDEGKRHFFKGPKRRKLIIWQHSDRPISLFRQIRAQNIRATFLNALPC